MMIQSLGMFGDFYQVMVDRSLSGKTDAMPPRSRANGSGLTSFPRKFGRGESA